MRRSLLVRLLAGFFVFAGAWVAYAQSKQAPAPAAIVVNKVKDDLYELEQHGNGNVAVYPTGDGMQNRVPDMSRQNKTHDDVSKMLQPDFGWGATGMYANSPDRVIAELKSAELK